MASAMPFLYVVALTVEFCLGLKLRLASHVTLLDFPTYQTVFAWQYQIECVVLHFENAHFLREVNIFDWKVESETKCLNSTYIEVFKT